MIEGLKIVRMKGLEPPRPETLDPKSNAATNYATCAWMKYVLQKRLAELCEGKVKAKNPNLKIKLQGYLEVSEKKRNFAAD